MTFENVEQHCATYAQAGELDRARLMLELHQSMVVKLQLETAFIHPPQPLFTIPENLKVEFLYRDARHEPSKPGNRTS